MGGIGVERQKYSASNGKDEKKFSCRVQQKCNSFEVVQAFKILTLPELFYHSYKEEVPDFAGKNLSLDITIALRR